MTKDAKGVHLSARSAANKKVPVVQGRPGCAPKGLNKDAVAAWQMAVENAPDGWITAIDLSVLEQWARDYAMYRRLQSLVDHEGYTIEAADGNVKPHPLFSVLFKTKAALIAEEKELGFTPAARARVRVGQKTDEDNDFADF